MKTCKKCDNTLSLSSFFKHGFKADGSIKYQSQCKDCIREKKNEYQRQWKIKNPDKRKESYNKYYQSLKNDPERYKKYREGIISQSWYTNRKATAEDLERQKLSKRKYREDMTDGYLKKIICGKSKIPYSLITQDVIELKRKQMLLKRELESINQSNHG